jgi:hypothetical protein
MTSGYVEFEFNLPEALLSSLIQVLDRLESANLATASLANIPDAQGVYQLYLDDELVYIGKTDAETGLRNRLERHRSKIQQRRGLDPSRVSFKAVRIYVFTAMDLETQLIAHYGGFAKVKWNGSGFGSNDPGRQRDTTTYREDHFDAIFQIDIDRMLDIALPHADTAATILAMLKNTLPYVFRYEGRTSRSRQPHPDLENTTVSTVAVSPLTARRVLEVVVPQLPAGWQATQLPSHIILYKENRAYPQGTVISRSTSQR